MSEKIGTYREIERGTTFFSIAIQENVKSDRNIVIEITNTCIGSDFVFGVIMNINRFFGNSKRLNGDVSINYDKTKPYTLPQPILMYEEPIYKNK